MSVGYEPWASGRGIFLVNLGGRCKKIPGLAHRGEQQQRVHNSESWLGEHAKSRDEV